MTGPGEHGWIPTETAIKLGVVVTLVVGVPVVALGFWISPLSAVGFAVALLVGLLAGIRAEVSVAWGVVWLAGLAAAAGTWAAGDAVWAMVVVGGVGLMVWPAHRFGVAGAVAMCSAVAAVMVVVGGGAHPFGAGLVAMTGAAWGVLVVTRLVPVIPIETVPARTAMIHGLSMAVAAGGAAGLAVWLGFGHGYWLVVAIAVVLQAEVRATGRYVSGIVRGTVLGASATALLALVVGPWWLIPIGVVAFAGSVAYAVQGDYPRQSLATTVAIVALGSTASSGDTFAYALERVGLIGGGVVLVLIVTLVTGRLHGEET